jgi:hypothetical protein
VAVLRRRFELGYRWAARMALDGRMEPLAHRSIGLGGAADDSADDAVELSELVLLVRWRRLMAVLCQWHSYPDVLRPLLRTYSERLCYCPTGHAAPSSSVIPAGLNSIS